MFGPSSTKRGMFRSARPRTSMFGPSLTKRDMFRSTRPKKTCFYQVRPGEIRFDRRDQNIYVSTKFNQARYVSTCATKTTRFRPSSTKRDTFLPARDQNIYVSTKFDQARYVLTSATKTSEFQPSSTKRDMFRSAWPQTSMFRLGSTKRDRFPPARPKHLCLDQVRLSEVCFDRHDHELLCFG